MFITQHKPNPTATTMTEQEDSKKRQTYEDIYKDLSPLLPKEVIENIFWYTWDPHFDIWF